MAEGPICIYISDDDVSTEVIEISEDDDDDATSTKKTSSTPPPSKLCVQEPLSPNSDVLLQEQEKLELQMALEMSRREYEAEHGTQEFSPQPSTSKCNMKNNKKMEKTWCKIRKEREREKNKCKSISGETPSKRARLEIEISSDESDGEFSDGLPDLDEEGSSSVKCPQVPPDDVTIEVHLIEEWDDQEDESQKCTENSTESISGISKVKEIVFDKESKNRLASILKHTKLNLDKKNVKDEIGSGDRTLCKSSEFSKVDTSEKNREETSSASSRHFLDFFLSDDLDSETNKHSTPQQKISKTKIANISGTKFKKSDFLTTSPLKLTKRQRKNVPRNTTQSTINTFYLPYNTEFTQSDLANTRNAKLRFPDDDIESLAANFSTLHINTVMVSFEEKDSNEFLSHGLEFLNNFSTKYKPTENMMKEVLNRCIIQSNTSDLIYKGYKTLLFVHHKYPNLVTISWDNIKDAVDDVGIGRGIPYQDPLIVMKTSLLLELAIVVYEDDLFSRDISDQRFIRQSSAYCNLSYDCAFNSNVRQIINWIICLLTSGEYVEIDAAYLRVPAQQQNHAQLHCQIQLNEIGKILPKLQKLLDVSINASSSCCDAAKAIASELLKSFIYLPNISHKMLLLHTMQSDLLRFKLVQLVLENHCEDTLPGLEFPTHLGSLVECYFTAMPVKNILTPPTTPQSEDEEDGVGAVFAQYSPAAVEELSVLLYYVVYSYLNCVRKKSHTALRRRARYNTSDLHSLSEQDRQDLDIFPRHVEALRGHFLSIADMTPKTLEYLKKMMCLSNMKS